ncbi:MULTISPECIES: hypothetical protein [unclassified Streptomyces]|uniref:hypothetical protein n=1 Tax=unclassified Streptomyces TaxID=2593676 RepID=UPI001487960E|nr:MULTISPECIES: hypothetical protein [unclassified Streptomyces]
MQNLFISFMRTVVPWGVALVFGVTGWLGIPIDSDAAAAAVTIVLGAVYYAVFRGLEELAERMAWRPLQLAAGLLLGWARPPAYEQPPVLPVKLKLDMDAMREDLAAMRRVLGVDEDRR